MTRSFTLLAAFAAAASLTSAQDTRTPDTRSSEFFTFSIQAEGMPLETLISHAEAQTGKAFIYSDVAALKGKIVKMLGTVRMPKAKAFAFFQAVLVTQGYALVPLGDDKRG